MFNFLRILCLFLLIGCNTSIKPDYHSKIKDEVYIDTYNSHVECTKLMNDNKFIVYINLRIISKKFRDIKVDVECYKTDRSIVIKGTASVEKRGDTYFTISNFSSILIRLDDIVCRITKIR